MSKFSKDEHKKILDEVCQEVLDETLSLREAAEFLSAETGISISHEGLRKIIRRKASLGTEP